LENSENQLIKDIESAFKERGHVKTSKEFAKLIGENDNGLSDIKAGRKRLTIDHIKNLKNSHPNFNMDWYLTGTGHMFLEQKGTDLQKAANNKQNGYGARETFYTDLIENNAEYSLIPRAVFKDYKIVPDKIIDAIIQSNENEKKAMREAMAMAEQSLNDKLEETVEMYEEQYQAIKAENERLEKENEELRKQISPQ
jgi:hypothetical protein